MIADTAVTMGSLWLSESLDNDELSGTEFPELNLNTFESEISRLPRRSNSFEMTSDMYSLLSSVSCDASVASSECSDDLCVDVDGDDNLFCDLQASIINLLDEGSDSNVLCLSNVDLTDGEWSSLSNDIDNHSTTSGYSTASSIGSDASSTSSSSKLGPTSKHRSSSHDKSKHHRDTNVDISQVSNSVSSQTTEHGENQSSQTGRKRVNSQGTDGRKWSHLSSTEQISVVEELSHLISTELGLREQLEVIRIIKPGAKVSPADREFVIDLETLDDVKLQRIEEYIKLHAGSTLDSSSEGRNTVQKKTSKRQKCQERRNQQKVVRQRQRKEYRQMMKERRSGLFVKEEVLALSATTDPGEDDIDVLM